MTTENHLGTPVYVRVWHDCSGQGNKQSWHLNKIVIVDRSDGQWYLFLCNKWLALGEDDARTSRLLHVAGKEEIAENSFLLPNNMKSSFWNDHLWLSVGYRKSRSRFTRVQRLSCCLAILFLNMVTNAMFFGTEGDESSESALTIGPISMSVQELTNSVITALIVAIPILIVTKIFSKTGERKQSTCNRLKRESQLPFWCLYLAYGVVILCVAAGAFFTILYALQWGKQKSEAWLLAFVLSFVESILLLEPLQVYKNFTFKIEFIEK